jgi:hypothetical protein
MEMNRHLFTSRNLTVKLGLLIGCAILVMTSSAFAQTAQKVVGELSVARSVSVNGIAARTSGGTIYNKSQLKTGGNGLATINMGRNGRAELGVETDFSFQNGINLVGGELRNGRLVLSVPNGVRISLNAPNGLVKTDGVKSAILTIEAVKGATHVMVHQGNAQVVSEGKTELITAGEEVALGSEAEASAKGWQTRKLTLAGLIGAGSTAGAAGAVATSASTAAKVATIGQAAKPVVVGAKTATFSTLLNAGINYSVARLLTNSRDPEQFFDATLTCRDHDNFLCKRRSGVTP